MQGRRQVIGRLARRLIARSALGVGAIALSGCAFAATPQARWALAPATPASASTASSPTTAHAGSTLTLRLDAPWPRAPRTLLLATAGGQGHVTIAGPDLATPRQYDVTLGTTYTLTDVPTGKIRIVTLQGLDEAGAPLAGAVLRAVGELKSGANALTLDAAGTAAGEVALGVITRDRTQATHRAEQLDLAALVAGVGAFSRELKLASPRLLDADALAADVHAASGTLPSASKPAYALVPGQVVLRASDVPPSVPLVAWVNDPISQPVTSRGGGPLVLGPVAPGTWTLTVQPDAPGWSPRTQSVTVGAGASQLATVAFATSQTATALPKALAPALASGADGALYALGGTAYDSTDGLLSFLGVLRYRTSDGWTATGAQLATPLIAPATADLAGQLYAFGGTDGDAVLGSALRYNPTNDTLGALPALPGARVVMGAAAGAVGSAIYLAGGTVDTNANPFTETLGFDTQTSAWLPGPFPALPLVRTHMASAVVDGRWYVFGGSVMEQTYSGGSLTSILTPQKAVHCFTPGAPGAWTGKAAMPTARSGARTVVVAGKVWVIGGSGPLGAPSRAVEVYDPATDSWSVKPPLRSARAFPACGFVDGKILVAGGTRGDEPTASLPVSDVEVLTP